MPIFFEKNAMETIWAWWLIRFHGVEGCSYFIFNDGSSEGMYGIIFDGGVRTKSEVSVLVMMIAAKEFLEKSLGFFLEGDDVKGPDTIRELEPMNFVSFSPNDGLCMKKGAIFVAKFNTFFP